MSAGAVSSTGRLPPETPDVERVLAIDMVRRGLPFAPAVVLLAGIVRGTAGAASASLATVVVLANLTLAAVTLAWAARVSLNAIMAAALGGFAARMGLLTLVIVLVKDQSWVDLPTLAVTILLTHLGLLFWETRFVSASLAYPALAPTSSREASP